MAVETRGASGSHLPDTPLSRKLGSASRIGELAKGDVEIANVPSLLAERRSLR